jgi:hypothetical protein
MPGTLTPAQMFDHELNVVKGWPSPYAVDKTKPIGTLVDDEVIFAGRVVQLGSVSPDIGKWLPGCANATGLNAPMPCFAWPNQADFDVSSDVGNISGGNLVALVASGAYEMESTEYMTSTFLPGDALVAENTATSADRGKLLKATTVSASGTKTIVGIVSDSGPITNDFKKTVVRFWPVFLPFSAT